MSVARTMSGRTILIAAALAVSMTGPVMGQNEPEAQDFPDKLDETLRGLLDRMKPALEDAFDLWDTLDQIDSPTNYDKPIILPNGDILIRRSPDAPEWQPESPDTDPDEPERRKPDPDDSTRT